MWGVPTPPSRALLPQMTYSLTRFAIYETVRDRVAKGSQGPLPFHQKVLLGSISGELPGGRGTGQAGGLRIHTGQAGGLRTPRVILIVSGVCVTAGLAGGFVGTPADLVNVRLVSPPPYLQG